MTRIVSIRNAHPRLRVPRAAVRNAVAVLDTHAAKFGGGCPLGELSVVFLSDPALARIHGRFMDDPTPTDVITFEGDDGGEAGSAGEICVSADTAARFVGLALPSQGRFRGKLGAKIRSTGPAPSRQDGFATELTLYLVHGWLHLAGYDDRKPVKKRRMRAAEKRALKLLRQAGAIPAFRMT